MGKLNFHLWSQRFSPRGIPLLDSHLLPWLLLLLLLPPPSLPQVWAQIAAVTLLRPHGTLDCTRSVCVCAQGSHANCLACTLPAAHWACSSELMPSISPLLGLLASLSHRTSPTEDKIKDRIEIVKISAAENEPKNKALLRMGLYASAQVTHPWRQTCDKMKYN